MKRIDCSQQKCPYPVIETRKALLAEPGIPLQVLVGDEDARQNVSRMATTMGYEVALSSEAGGTLMLLTPAAETQGENADRSVEKSVVVVSADLLGLGDDELGRILLKNFLITLVEVPTPPTALYFINAGVKLCCAGSEALEALDALACRGVDIASCGLCLEFYHLKPSLAVGRVTTMVEIVEAQLAADRVLRP